MTPPVLPLPRPYNTGLKVTLIYLQELKGSYDTFQRYLCTPTCVYIYVYVPTHKPS